MSGEHVHPTISIPVMNPKSLVVFCPNCCRTYEKRGLHVGDIRCDECSNHGDQLVVEVRRYEDVHVMAPSGAENGVGRSSISAHSEPAPDGLPCQDGMLSGATQCPSWFFYVHREILELVRAEQGVSSAMIADRIGYTQHYVSSVLKKLLDAGYVVRRPHPLDARIKLYYPAEARP